MKRNHIFYIIKVPLFFALFICTLLGNAVAATAPITDADQNKSTPVAMNSRIMEIDLDQNRMVIAEEEIQLLVTKSGHGKIWQTTFKDSTGSSMPASSFKAQDRVLLEGSKNNAGTIQANSITMIESYKAPVTEKKKNNSKIQLKDGTWVN